MYLNVLIVLLLLDEKGHCQTNKKTIGGDGWIEKKKKFFIMSLSPSMPIRSIYEYIKKRKPDQIMIVTSNPRLIAQFIEKYKMVLIIPTLGMHVGYCMDTKLFICNPLLFQSTELTMMQQPLLDVLSNMSLIVYMTSEQVLPEIGIRQYSTTTKEAKEIEYAFCDGTSLKRLAKANIMVHIQQMQQWNQKLSTLKLLTPQHHILSRIFHKRKTCFLI